MLMDDVHVRKEKKEPNSDFDFVILKLCQFYSNVLYGSNDSEFILCDTFFTFTNLIKTNDQVVKTLSDVLAGPKSEKRKFVLFS